MAIRAGIIGVGIMGAEHARLLSREVSGSTVTAVFDVDAKRAAGVAELCGARVHDDPIALIEDDEVDCVLIASSDTTHERFVLAALAAGKPVLCEKPLAPEAEACERILAAEVARGERLVTVGFMRRFDPGYETVRSGLRAGGVGAALMVHNVHRNAGAGRFAAAMLITGSAVHEFDIVRWLLDDEPDSIDVHLPPPSAHGGGTQDAMLIVVRMKRGTLVDIEVFVNAGYGYEVRCELVGEQGTLLLDTPAGSVRRAAGVVGRAIGSDWRERFVEAYRRELQQWVDALEAHVVPPLASAWDGYVATATAAAAILACETGTTQHVTLADKPGIYR